MSNLDIAVKFAEKIKDTEHIIQIVLFGSVARGEDNEKSDIDIAIIHDSKDQFSMIKEVNKNKNEKIQTTFIHINELANEREIAGALSGEGLLLYGKPIYITEKKMSLSAKVLIFYSMKDIKQNSKVKLSRALYGSISISSSDGKKYVTKTKGIMEPGIEKISKGVLLVNRKKSSQVRNILKRFNVKFKEIPVWTY